MQMKRIGPVVEVEWLDALSRGGWGTRKTYAEERPLTCLTAGYLLAKTKDKIIIVQSSSYNAKGEERDLTDSITIPRALCLRMKRLR